MNATPNPSEQALSHLPALHALVNIGFTYLTREEVEAERRSRLSQVLLEGVLEKQLRAINRVRAKGAEYPFTDSAMHGAIQALKDTGNDGLARENEKLFDLLCLGKSFEQTIDGDTKSYSLHFIDWARPERNAFHVAEEFIVERTANSETLRPDLVLFVNGIPLVVIECKRPGLKDPLGEAIAQQRRNQQADAIPQLYLYAQLLFALAGSSARYGTVLTKQEYWAEWQEEHEDEKALRATLRRPLPAESTRRILAHRPPAVAQALAEFSDPAHSLAAQDRLLAHLCRPTRLLDLIYGFTVFDGGQKKVARYQQYFAVKSILARIRKLDPQGHREGGVVWHTQGSGKSLTMVMLAKAIALAPDIPNPRVVLVTDRVDLDDQINGTFRACGLEPVKAKSGTDLAGLLNHGKATIITTLIHKFESALRKGLVLAPGQNLFVLVDEAHRSQAGKRGGKGEFHMQMRLTLPHACYLGFTGTPLTDEERKTEGQFGRLIHTYAIDQAVADKAVVPLLYEGRKAEVLLKGDEIDRWVDRVCEDLTPNQATELKRRFAHSGVVKESDPRLLAVAWDISEHFAATWKDTPFKGQIVTRSKATAIRLKQLLDEFGKVSSEVLVSAPDEREGNEDGDYDGKPQKLVLDYWIRTKARFGNERNYNEQLINSFKNGGEPELIIVVDKLITGFDAPRNTVLYLDRPLKGHTLLQAIARVNRVHEGKEYGYIIDYEGVLGNLDEALTTYGGALEGFSKEDLGHAVTDVEEEVRRLPVRHRRLLDLFAGLPNRQDNEAYEQHLADEKTREHFYQLLSEFSRTMAIAFASLNYRLQATPQELRTYRDDLRYFQNLRVAVRRRYADELDFSKYEPRIRKLIDTHLQAGDVQPVTEQVSIFDKDAFAREVEKLQTPASKADTIAHRTLRTITEKWEEDPVFFKRFSDLIRQAIEDYRLKRIADAEYLRRVAAAQDAVTTRKVGGLPTALQHHDAAIALFNVLNLPEISLKDALTEEALAEQALRIDALLQETAKIVAWKDNTDVVNRLINQIEDLALEIKNSAGRRLLSEANLDALIQRVIPLAKVHYGHK
jgi:type I restriction enzyme R subunit